MQSIIDPSREKALYNYNLDDFKNSIWENFLGSQVQINKLEDADGTSKVTNKIVNKMGPVQLDLNDENLYNAWEHGRNSLIEDFKGLKDGQVMKTETWICRPPNIMMFNLNRVDFDKKQLKLVKNNSRFEFDQTIYLDMFLNQNKLKATEHKKELEKMKSDLKSLKDAYKKYMEGGDQASS